MTLAGFVVLKIPFATPFSAFVAANSGRGEEEGGASDLIAHLTWFPVNEKLVADGHERTVSRSSWKATEACDERNGRISFRHDFTNASRVNVRVTDRLSLETTVIIEAFRKMFFERR